MFELPGVEHRHCLDLPARWGTIMQMGTQVHVARTVTFGADSQ